MNLAISNIAWDKDEDSDIYKQLTELCFNLEIAPSRLFDNPEKEPDNNIVAVKDHLMENGIKIIAMQSLLYGHPELTLFENDESRQATLAYLKNMIDLAEKIGAKVLVFGSPKNRIMKSKTTTEFDIAKEFFGAVGEYAKEKNITFCIEPNPEAYGTNFINRTKEAVDLVKEVDSSGFKINIDLGAIIMNNEDIEVVMPLALPYASHFHISEANLATVELEKSRHQRIAKMLKMHNYNHYVSIEMKKAGEKNIESIVRVLEFVKEIYG